MWGSLWLHWNTQRNVSGVCYLIVTELAMIPWCGVKVFLSACKGIVLPAVSVKSFSCELWLIVARKYTIQCNIWNVSAVCYPFCNPDILAVWIHPQVQNVSHILVENGSASGCQTHSYYVGTTRIVFVRKKGSVYPPYPRVPHLLQ